MTKNRFVYNGTSQMIRDELTGFTYFGNKEICDLLNQLNNRADRNAEQYCKLKELINEKRKNQIH